MPMQLGQHIVFVLFQRQPGIFRIAFKQVAFFQTVSNAVAEGMNECVKFTVRRRLGSMKTRAR